MTEGIIQEVIKKFWTKDLNDEYDLQQAIKELEQELIERIKEESISMPIPYVHLQKLIGDSNG